VYEERADWALVEVPGGFMVYVYGEYIRPSSESGMVEVNASNVRQRPAPSSDIENVNLKPVLGKGTKLRLIGRVDEAKPLAEDWIKCWSAPGTGAWVQKSDLEALASSDDGAKLWGSAVLVSAARPAVSLIGALSAKPASAGSDGTSASEATDSKKGKDQPKAMELLREADRALAGARERESRGLDPDYPAVHAQYLAAKELADEPTRGIISSRLRDLEVYSDARELNDKISAQKAAYERAKLERENKMREAEKNRDQFAGRFDSRGWLERRVVAGQSPTYLVRWGGDTASEIVCNGGRYDLDAFVGFDIGVNGIELRPAGSAGGSFVTRPRVLDVSRIEVISGRAPAR
jgi:hypothetical protein